MTKIPKTVVLIECRACTGCYFGGDEKVILYPGNENEQPDEIYIITHKVAKCPTCKEYVDRTKGKRGKRLGF